MLNIHDLLADPVYREFLTKRPTLPKHYTSANKPFRLYVLLKKDHKWHSKRFGTYDEAFTALKKYLPHASDAAINCPGVGFSPPQRIVRIKGKYFTNAKGEKDQVTKLVVWLPKVPDGEFEDHNWCPYCRRPTVFRRFTRHHALPVSRTAGVPIDPTLLRCSICGASEAIVPLRRK